MCNEQAGYVGQTLGTTFLHFVFNHVDSQQGFARLQHERLSLKQMRWKEYRVLNLNQGAKGAIVVFYKILASDLLNGWMNSRDWYIVSNSYVALSIPSNLKILFFLSVENEEYLALWKLLLLNAAAQSFQDDKVVLWALNIYDVYDSVVEVNAEWKLLLAQLAVHFLVFYYHVALLGFNGLVSLQPLPQALQMNSTHCATASTWTDHGIETVLIDISHIVVIIETNSADHTGLLWKSTLRLFLFLHQLDASLDVLGVVVGQLRLVSQLTFLSRGAFVVLDSVHLQMHHVFMVYQFKCAIDAFAKSLNLLATNINIIDVNNRVLSFTSRTQSCLVALRPLRPKRPGRLALLRLVLIDLGLRIVNVSDSESDPAHSDNLVFLEFESLCFVGLVRIVLHHVPQLFLGVRVDGLQVYFVFVVDPEALTQSLLFFELLMHDSADLAGLLVLLVQVHCFGVYFLVDIAVLSCQTHNNFLLLAWRPTERLLVVGVNIDCLLMPEQLRILTKFEVTVNHEVLGVVVKKTEWVLAPGPGWHDNTIKISKSPFHATLIAGYGNQIIYLLLVGAHNLISF